MNKRIFIQNYKKIDFKFYQNIDDFIVKEESIDFTNRGNFIILKIQKQKLSTWDLIDILAKNLKIYENEIGYAGLKDKNATTTQYISIPRKYSKEIKRFKHSKIQILETCLHSTKLNIGDLKGNSFEINLHEVDENDINTIQKRLKSIAKIGMPNYFGYQRFGKDYKQNLEKARRIIYEDLDMKDHKLKKMLISMYQSDLFNKCLAYRVKSSHETFKLLSGDVFLDLNKNKFFTPKNISEAMKNDFIDHKIVPTGLLCGKKAFRSLYEAREIEIKFDDMYIQEKGLRRAFLAFPKIESVSYDKKESKCKLIFSLPKASYATVLIENISS